MHKDQSTRWKEGGWFLTPSQPARTVILERRSSRKHSAYFLSPFVLHKRSRKRVSALDRKGGGGEICGEYSCIGVWGVQLWGVPL